MLIQEALDACQHSLAGPTTAHIKCSHCRHNVRSDGPVAPALCRVRRAGYSTATARAGRLAASLLPPASSLGLTSNSQSPATPLPLANTSPCRVCRGLSPPSHSTHRHSESNSTGHGALGRKGKRQMQVNINVGIPYAAFGVLD